MKFTTVDDVKKWLRGLPLLKKELEMKASFYEDLTLDSKKMGTIGEKYIKYYGEMVKNLQEELLALTKKVDLIFSYLDPDERMIFTAKYLKCVSWDTIEFHVHFSRRHAIRIHADACEKLVGLEIGGVDNGEEKG